MLGYMHEEIIEELESFRTYLRSDHIEYYFKCVRKRRSCIVAIILYNPTTNRKVIELKIKVRNRIELTGRLEDLLTSCRHFARGASPSGSPEY